MINHMTAVHELFHSLGFSNKLFDQFRNCSETDVVDDGCALWNSPVVRPVGRTFRLVTGAVMREMRKHFNCSSMIDFGGPLQVESGKATSHWDSVLMHSSIMGSREQKPYQTLIDPISLAVFEDTGWYKVNYSQADKFIWGQGQGCEFGVPDFCEEQEGFCLNNMTGCHHLRLSKARCNFNIENNSTCGVFAADQKPCFMAALNSTSSDIDIETFSSSSRCFFSSLTPTHLFPYEKNSTLQLSGRCLERRCDGDKYYVRVLGGDWLLCSPESHIQVEGFKGSVLCASYQVMCSDFTQPEPPLEVDTSTPGSISHPGQHRAALGSWEQSEHSFICSDMVTSSAQLYFGPALSLMRAITSALVVYFS